MKLLIMFIVLILSTSTMTYAGEADVVKVDVKKSGDRDFRFDVTVLHDDTGWDHYADKWDVVAPDGSLLGTRILLHPHVNEQPFTRSLSNVKIPGSISQVSIRAHDSVHSYGGKVLKVALPTE